jgi:hypothetical protein
MSSPPRSVLRGAARSVLDVMGAAASSLQVRVLVRRAPQRGVTVLDIDNTLADTWPSFSRSWPSRAARLSSLPVLPGVKSEIHDAGLRRDDLIVFLSHRSWRHWRVTRQWLRRHGFSVGVANLVLVAQAADKVKHLKRLTATGRRVTYWDDLSYAHEEGEARRYDAVIREVLTLDLDYHGADEIESIVTAAGGR